MCSLMIPFQKGGSQLLEEMLLSIQTGKQLV